MHGVTRGRTSEVKLARWLADVEAGVRWVWDCGTSMVERKVRASEHQSVREACDSMW